MIKAIVFDSGGVIINQHLFFERLGKIFMPKESKIFWHQINIEAIPLCKNLISEEEYWNRISRLTGKDPKKIPKNLWSRGYTSGTKANGDVMEIIKKLKNKYKLAIVSNSIKSHEKINRKRGIFDMFDEVVLSHKVGLTKDSKKIFLLAAKRLKVKPVECIFIDDVADFVKVAKSAGMNGILFKNSAQLNKDMERILRYSII